MDVCHPVREVHALETPLVEDVRICPAAAEAVARFDAASLQGSRGEAHRLVVSLEPVAARTRVDRRLDVAVGELRGESNRLEHLLHELPELALVVAARLGREPAALWDDVAGGAALDLPDVGGRLLVQTPEPEIRDRARRRRDRGAALLRVHAGVRGPTVKRRVELALV